MHKLVIAGIAWFFLTFASWAETPILSATEAKQRMEAGELILLDIRTPKEWRETGIAKGAWPVSMHRKDFGTRLNAILAVYPPEQIALICAVGGRSKYITDALTRNGITGVVDLSEGMMGNKRGPGWIARGMETVSVSEAKAVYEATAANW